MLLKKRGMSHVEIILSFVLFIAAVSAGFYFLNPGNAKRIADSSLEYAFREIIKNSSVEVVNFGIKINNEAILEDESQNQQMIEVISINLSRQFTDAKSRVSVLNGEILASKLEGSILNIKAASGGWSGIEFINVVLSEEFIDDEIPSAELIERYYDLASVQNQEVISEAKFSRLVEFYNSDYYEFKKEFNLPDRANIGFSMKIDDREIAARREIPEKTEVFSGSKDFIVLKQNEEQSSGTLIISVW